MTRKTQKPLTRAQLRFKACTYLQIPPSLVLDVIPNCARNKYFIHWLTVTQRQYFKHRTQGFLEKSKELEKQVDQYLSDTSMPNQQKLF